ncbi:TetR family transcriptional regulator [Amycolatopsis sp. NPDC003865]
MTIAPRRDAASTRTRLLSAAALLFARDGYASTSVRDIADAAGANVALINRYFGSKEGLFSACLARGTARVLDESGSRAAELLLGDHQHLLLLAHHPGTERANRIRLAGLRAFGTALSAESAQQTGDDGEKYVLPAQLLLAAAIGVALLRSAGLQPLASAREQALLEPLAELAGLPRAEHR